MARSFQWDPVIARFRDADTGRYISRDAVRQAVDLLILKAQDRIRIASNELRSGNISIGEWQSIMRDQIKNTHLATEALLRGGWAQMTQADFGRVGQRVREQYDYLANFTQELLDGIVVTDGRFMSRAGMYPASARTGYHEEETLQLQQLGYTEERNVLRPAEHCDVCVEQTALDWVPIGSLIPIGDRTCLSNDKCFKQYR